MSSNYWTEETPSYSDFNDVEGCFTNLQFCEHSNDTDSQCSYSDLSNHDDNRQVKIHFSPLTKENTIEANEDLNITKNKNEQKSTASLLEPFDDIRDLIREDLYKFVFMPMSKQFTNYVQCRLIRNKSGLIRTFRLEVEYDGDGNSLCLLTAARQLRMSGQTHYSISVNPKFSHDYYFAELESTNLTGTSYILYYLNGDERQQLAVILYETNFLGIKGPRKIEALLPKFNNQMQELLKENNIVENDCFIHLHNKPPDWNPYTCTYSLAFEGKDRVTVASIKNFQMVIENEEHVEQFVMQFGRMSENEFSCDFRYPLSLIQTFAIALSAVESRLFRE